MCETHEGAKRWLALLMLVLGLFVVLSVMETRAPASLTSLKPFFGIPFGVAFLAAQFGYVFIFNIKRGWIWILGICIVRIPFYFLTSNTYLLQNSEALTGMAELVTSAACVSGCMLGLLVLARRL